MSFEEDVARLEAIAVELEGDGVSLDRALQLFEEGVTRLRRAAAELGRAQSQVSLLVERVDGAFALRPLDAAGRTADAGSGDRR